MRNRPNNFNLKYSESVNETVSIKAFVVGGEMKRLSVPLDLITNLAEEINESGSAAILFSDQTYLIIEGFMLASDEFMATPRIVVIEGDKQ